MKIVTVLGARPQFIKAGSVSREILKRQSGGCDISEVIVHTGQHYDFNMSDVFFEEMKIPKPSYQLGIGGRSHGAMTGQMIEKVENILFEEKPDVLMVYGDTNSTLAGSLAASKLHIPIAHVEAGLRSFNMAMPEEVNRVLTDRVSRWLFCPTQTAISNLIVEGAEQWRTGAAISVVGDVMLDGALFYKKYSKRPDGIPDEAFILCTVHRAENTNSYDRLCGIVEAINDIAREKRVVIPLHPRTRKKLSDFKLQLEGATVIDPVGYLNMVWLIESCDLVMTDSGGLQKEAYFFSKPCITMRDETEWVELVSRGVNRLAGASKSKILNAYCDMAIVDDSTWSDNGDLYGSGNASCLIMKEILGV